MLADRTAARGFTGKRSLACLVTSLFFIGWITLAGRQFSAGATILLLALPWVLVGSGSMVTSWLEFPATFVLDFLVGMVVISVTIMVWKLFIPLSLWIFLIVLLLALIAGWRFSPRSGSQDVSGPELLAVVVSLAATTGWSQDLLTPIHPSDHSFIFKPWSDFFFHATIVARSLGRHTLLQVGNYEWKGLPAIVYHYASYSLTTCLVTAGKLPTYISVLGFWAPFGCFLSGLSAYTLGRSFWNESAGLAALAAVMLIPDLTLLDIGHPFYGYHWLQEVDPGGFYGVTVAGMALVFIIQGMRDRRRAWIVAGMVIGVLVAFFKVHIFAASFPLIFSFAVLAWPCPKPRRWLVLGGCIAVAIILVELNSYFHVGPDVHFDFSGAAWYWRVLAALAQGTPVSGYYAVFDTMNPFPAHLLRAIVLLLVSALGISVIGVPITWWLAVRSNKSKTASRLVLAAIAVLLLMTFTLSRNLTLGLQEELIHRPFVWAYWVVSALTAGSLFATLAPALRTPRLLGSSLILLALLVIPAWFGRGLQRGKWPGAKAHENLSVDRGLVECARFIREHSSSSAIAQDSHLDSPFPILCALSERPSFANRPNFWTRISNSFRGTSYQKQLAQLQALQAARSLPELKEDVRETGIRWYMTHPADSLPWPIPVLEHAAFQSDGYKVYDLQEVLKSHGGNASDQIAL